jgi:hypothetical protein
MRRTAIAINPPTNPKAGKDQTINPVPEPQAVPAGNPPVADLAAKAVPRAPITPAAAKAKLEAGSKP